MTNMKPKGGASIEAPSLCSLWSRSATGLNDRAAAKKRCQQCGGGWMPENISGVPAGRSVFHLTSPLIGLLASVVLEGNRKFCSIVRDVRIAVTPVVASLNREVVGHRPAAIFPRVG